MRTGDFSTSLAEARDGLKRWPQGEWGWKFRLLYAEDFILLGQPKEARTVLESQGRPTQPALLARWMMDSARLAIGSQPDQARAQMREALQVALRAPDPYLACMLRLRLSEQTGFEEAEAFDRQALAEAQGLHDPYLAAWARLDLGYNRVRAARFDEAIPYFVEGVEATEQIGAKGLMCPAKGNLAFCYLSLGESDRALATYRSAADLSAKIGLRAWQYRNLTSIGNIYMNRGELDRAADYQKQALDIVREANDAEWTGIVLNNLALVMLKKGDLGAAESYNDQALEIKRRLKDQGSLAYSELNSADIHDRQGKYAQAEADYQTVIQQARQAHAPVVLWEAHSELADMYREWKRPRPAEAEYRLAIDAIDREWSKLDSVDFRTTFLSPASLIGIFQKYIDLLLQGGQTARALEIAESSRARVLSQKLENAEALPANFEIDKLFTAARGSHTVILSYWLAPQRSAVWVIGPGGLSYRPLAPAPQLADLVGKYAEAITGGEDPLAGAQWADLYNAVLEPVYKLIPRGSNVIIVPDGALHQLNFETLVAPDPQPHYWIEEVAIATAPSLRVLRPADATMRAPRLLLLGDPQLSGQDFGPLPSVKREIAAVEGHFPAANRVALTGKAAVPGEYAKASPANFTYIHFATHAAANKESPLNSAIILSHQGDRFKLYARDVAPVHLTADLVTISACKSAGPKAYSGEGLMGFAWAFLYAGAQNVIATLWDEDDATSVALMGGLYDGIAKGETPARALRAAKLAVMHAGGMGRLPYYWGALAVFTRQIGGKP